MDDKAFENLYLIYQIIQPIWNGFATFLGIFSQFFSLGLDLGTFFLGFL
jgi:hypothetical protein